MLPAASRFLADSEGGLGPALRAAREYLLERDTSALLREVGSAIDAIPLAEHLDKRFIQASHAVGRGKPPDDLLTGQGLFYLTEQRRLYLDCTAGHYQMTWGYNHPELNRTICEAIEAGIVWDDHSNIPGGPVKALSGRLVEATGPDSGLDTVNVGMCTGSSASAAALKIILKQHEEAKPNVAPVFIAIDGNYHGTDMFTQRLRGMWGRYFHGVDVVQVQPNDIASLREAFGDHHGRVAAFFAEPILMNREAILLATEYLQEARALCDESGACLVLDEIQTGFWCPEVFMFRQYDIVPDMLVIGKGMTSGFHPLSALVFRRRYDCLEQYDAINTNGAAPLAALAALCCLDLIERDRDRIAETGDYYFEQLRQLPAQYAERVAAIHGSGLLGGIKFHAVHDALDFHQRCLTRGLWVRAHAYHEGHSTVLTKLGLLADTQVADFVVGCFSEILEQMGE